MGKSALVMILVLFMDCRVFAKDVSFTTYAAGTKSYVKSEAIELRGLTIAKSCGGQKPECMAVAAVRRKAARSPASNEMTGNPAGRYCMDQKAMNRIFFDDKKREFDFCVFPDGSFVDAWQLYNKHYGNL